MKKSADKIFFRPIIPLLLAVMTGIIAGAWIPGYTAWACGSSAIFAAVIIVTIKRCKYTFFAPLILYASLGYLSLQPWVSPHFPAHHINHFLDKQAYEITGTIKSEPYRDGRRTRFIIEADHLVRENFFSLATGRIQMAVYGKCPDLMIGDTIRFKSKIRSFRNFGNPGAFNYQQYMTFRGISGAAYTSGKHLSIIEKPPKSGISRRISNFRKKLSQFIETTAGVGDEGAVLKALIIGDRSGISNELYEIFRRTGVGHLLAISGLHIGMIATVSFFLFRTCLSYIKPALWYAWTRKGAAILSLIPVCIYGILAGLSPSTQRAVIMVWVFLMTFLLQRDQNPINTLFVAAFIILTVYPPSLFSISFQLSFTAVFSIIYGFEWRGGKREIRKPVANTEAFRNTLASYIYASTFAILGTLPFSMRYFNQVSLVGLFGNLVAVPLIGIVVVPLGLFSAFLYLLSHHAAAILLNVPKIFLTFVLYLLEILSELPNAAIKTITPSIAEIICYYILVWALLNIIKQTQTNRKLATQVAVIIFLIFCIDGGYWIYRRHFQPDLRATMIDVGQGTAALLEIPGGKNMLIDGGGFSDNATFDVGAKIIAPFLWRKKITTVHTLILTHPNSDHLNGLLYIAEHFNVKEIWTNGEPGKTMGYLKLLETVKNNKISMPPYDALPRSTNVNGVRLDILYPPEDFLVRKKTEKWRNTNNNSLVVRIQFGDTSLLFPGDIEKKAEAEMVRLNGNTIKSTVLISPHHGSRGSSSEVFLEEVSPHWVIVSSGWRNRFRLPHPSVLSRYEKHGCKVINTALNGAVSITSNGRSVTVKPFNPTHAVLSKN